MAKVFDWSIKLGFSIHDDDDDDVDFNIIHALQCTLCHSKIVAKSMVQYQRHAFIKMRACITITKVAKLNVVDQLLSGHGRRASLRR